MSNKFGYSQLTQSVSPDAEDLSLILGALTRGRSFSTTTTPKTTQSNSAKEKFVVTNPELSSVPRRKKSMPNTSKEKNTSTAEDFFIEVILQRHARRLLEEKKLEDLGKMSATLDFHLVGWLGREKDRAARIEDFVSVLKQLHSDLNWPKPTLDLFIEEEGKFEQESPSLSLDSSIRDNYINGIESGYSSLPILKDPIETNSTCIQRSDMISNYSTANAINSTLPSINEEFLKMDKKGINSSKATDAASICSEAVSVFSTDFPFIAPKEVYYSLSNINCKKKQRLIPHKLEVKIRYLLQIFIEANCLEYSLVLSILLLDAASISRITNTAIRSGSLPACRQIRNALKDITRWSFHECFGYRNFMMKLQPQINLLDQFVIQQESIPFVRSELEDMQLNEKNTGNLSERTGKTAFSEDIHLRSDQSELSSHDMYSEKEPSTTYSSNKNFTSEKPVTEDVNKCVTM